MNAHLASTYSLAGLHSQVADCASFGRLSHSSLECDVQILLQNRTGFLVITEFSSSIAMFLCAFDPSSHPYSSVLL